MKRQRSRPSATEILRYDVDMLAGAEEIASRFAVHFRGLAAPTPNDALDEEYCNDPGGSPCLTVYTNDPISCLYSASVWPIFYVSLHDSKQHEYLPKLDPLPQVMASVFVFANALWGCCSWNLALHMSVLSFMTSILSLCTGKRVALWACTWMFTCRLL